MQIQTTDPVNGEKVTNIYAPFVVERDGEDARKIYFTSDENKKIYLYIENLQQKCQ
jgi:YHS domain-containing protein